MAQYKTDKDGDHIVKIAQEKGYFDWKTLWAGNKKLQDGKQRKNPLVLFTGDKSWPGDVLELPPKALKPQKQKTDEHVAYEVPKNQLCLRLRILKADFSPIKDAAFKLEVTGGKTYEGKTDANGRVCPDGADAELPNLCREAKLSVQMPASSAEEKPDDKAGKDTLKGDVSLTWTLRIGRLNPVMEKAPTKACTSGVQQRLNNLGFYCGPVDGLIGPNTKLAIEKFQSLFCLKVDGVAGTGETQPKLSEVHDTGEAVPTPTGDEPTKTTVDEAKFKKSEPTDIGHVAPDFIDAGSPFVNTLVVAPEYRIKLDLGSIEQLFRHAPASKPGRMERLQVAGLFYFPMKHNKAVDALDFGWKYYCDELGGSDAALKSKIEKFVVDGGKLPPPAGDPTKPGADNFARLRVPGGYCYTFCPSYPKFKPNHDTDYKMAWTQEELHDAELMCARDNPVLGAIPLVANVETRYGSTGDWQPAKDVSVYFQLQEPYELPAYDDKKSPMEQLNRPPLRESDMQTATNTGVGPAKHVKAAMEQVAKVAGDPQVDNCTDAHGGKRQLAVADNVLELKVDLASHKEQSGGTHKKELRPGLHAAHADPTRAGQVLGPFLEAPEAAPADGDKHKHAIRAKTNEHGVAGIVFRPSLKGGDRYRLRAYIGPPTLPSDGGDAGAVAVDTGTLVVWRNVRVSKVRRMPCTAVADTIKNDIKDTLQGLALNGIWLELHADPEKALKFKTGVTKKDGTQVGYAAVDLAPAGDPACEYVGFAKQLARSFCEVELDPKAAACDLTTAEWRRALAAAVTFAKANATTGGGHTIDVDKLVITDTAKADCNNAFVMIPVRMPKAYNAAVAAPKRVPVSGINFLNDASGHFDTWFDMCLVSPFIHDVADNGYLPGLVMLQIPTISTWHATSQLGDYSIGLGSRGTIVLSGKDKYPYPKRQALPTAAVRQKRAGTTEDKDGMGYSSLVTHEWGHCLFLDHAPPTPSPGNVAIHDAIADGYCVMSYETTEGDYCGKCALAVQGWGKINTLP